MVEAVSSNETARLRGRAGVYDHKKQQEQRLFEF